MKRKEHHEHNHMKKFAVFGVLFGTLFLIMVITLIYNANQSYSDVKICKTKEDCRLVWSTCGCKYIAVHEDDMDNLPMCDLFCPETLLFFQQLIIWPPLNFHGQTMIRCKIHQYVR